MPRFSVIVNLLQPERGRRVRQFNALRRSSSGIENSNSIIIATLFALESVWCGLELRAPALKVRFSGLSDFDVDRYFRIRGGVV